MLTEKFFTPEDTATIEKVQKGMKKVLTIGIPIAIPLAALIGWLAARKNPKLIPLFVVIFILIFVGPILFLLLKQLKNYRKDLFEGTKLSGELIVKSLKSEKDKRFLIAFDSAEVKLIAVNKEVYERVAVGDQLYIEISKFSGTVFKLRNNEDLLIGTN